MLYRVTPVFQGQDLVARGVLMEGLVRGGQRRGRVPSASTPITCSPGWTSTTPPGTTAPLTARAPGTASQPDRSQGTYVLNISSKKFHLPSCGGVKDIKSENRQDYTGPRQALIDQGYQPCGRCKP